MVNNREEIIQQIKDCGWSIINNAENIINNYEYNVDLAITCYIGMCGDKEPRIVVESEFVPEKYVERTYKS